MKLNAESISSLREALGQVIANERREWRRERELIEAQAREAVAELRARIVELERDAKQSVSDRLATLKDGEPGVSVTLDDVAPLIATEVQRLFSTIKPPENGKDADPEALAAAVHAAVEERVALAVAAIPPAQPGKDADPEVIVRLVGEAVAALPSARAGDPGPAGESVTLDQLAPLVAETVAREVEKLVIPAGQKGEPGDPGMTVTVDDLAPAVAEAVAKAIPELEARLIAALPPGKQGEPGKSVTVGEITPILDEIVSSRVAELPPAPRGERGPEGPAGKLPVAREWEDRVYYEGDVALFQGSTYQALSDTGRAPPHEDWACIARAGRDGADGRSFKVASTYDPGKDYRELEVVALNGGSFVARTDNPGPCPGAGWQLIASQGKQGKPGERGGPGLKGDRGEAGHPVVGAQIDGDGLLRLTNGDGSVVDVDLYPVLSRLG